MSFLEQLNPAQRAAVEATDGPVMIVAGAGSGKTRVLTYRTAHLIDRGVRPDAILALTFTNKAADEMKTRIATLVGLSSKAMWIGTFHSLFARILRLECERIGYTRNFSIYDTDDSLALIRSVMSAMGISAQVLPPQGVRSRISKAKNSLTSPEQVASSAFDQATKQTADIFAEYQRKLVRGNAMDFDDLLLNPLMLFSRHPDVLQRYQYRFSHILVDEYQDTNRVQYALLRALASHRKNICVVGDDAQSIYAFRGADIRNILDFEKDYPESRVFRLEQNYRSTKTILAAADSLIRHNRDQIAKRLWTSNAAGDPVVVEDLDDDRLEAQYIVQRVEDETRRRKLALNDLAVLYRTNAQSRSIEDALRRSGIPYIIVGGVAFYRRKEIKDVLAYLKFLANPRDDESLLRIINEPARAIGDTTVQRLKTVAAKGNTSLFDALSSPHLPDLLADRTVRAVRGFHTILAKYLALKETMSASELARALIDEVGFLRLLKEEGTPEALSRRENIQELVSALTEYSDQHPDAGLEQFLEEVSLVSDIDTADFGRNAVTLMTLHAAKGLEFPVVFVTGLEEGLFPISLATNDRVELEEERRLMYVGMTRAKDRLYLTWARTRYRQGERSYSVRSRFLDEIDAALLEQGSAPSVHRPRPAVRDTPHREGAYAPRPARRRPAHGAEGDSYASDPMPSYEHESQETSHVRVGARVEHEAFGPGRIVAITGKGEDARAVVEFESVGRKQLLLKYAHLRIS
jgi:DNA helicase II / ATP-dependent DNA helicase PcrA